MTQIRNGGWVLALALAVAAGPLAAGQAAAQTVQPPHFRECEAEIGAARHRGEERALEHGSLLQLACGLGDRHEAEVSIQRQRDEDGATRQLGLEGRTLLTAAPTDEKTAWRWVLKYGISFDHGHDAGWRQTGRFVALQWGLAPAEDWWLEGELGSERDLPERRDRTPWSLSLETEVGDAATWKLELSGTDRARPDLALEWTLPLLPDRIELKLAAEMRVGRPRERGVALGLVFPF